MLLVVILLSQNIKQKTLIEKIVPKETEECSSWKTVMPLYEKQSVLTIYKCSYLCIPPTFTSIKECIKKCKSVKNRSVL